MLLLMHILLSSLLAIVLFPIYNWNVIIIVLTNIIDIDHYFVFVWKFKRFGLKEIYNYFKNIRVCDDIAIFHTWEFLIILGILSLYFKILFLIFIGTLFHIILDIIDTKLRGIKRHFSLIIWLKRRFKQKKTFYKI